MLCLACATQAEAVPGNAPGRSRRRETEDVSRIRRLLCSGCGCVLPLTDAADGMLSKLAQLDAFGLGAFARPLLQRRQSIICGGDS